MGMAQFGLACSAIEAVVLGRTGDRAGATALMADVRARMRRLRHSYAPMHVQELLIARAALRDGWGDPVTWLREAEAFFAAGGYDRTARRCRTMLGAAGAPMPRRGRGDSSVPTALRALGVTSREVDVLKLVAAGMSNREIGGRAVPRRRRPSSGTSAACWRAPAPPTGPRSPSWRGCTTSKLGDPPR